VHLTEGRSAHCIWPDAIGLPRGMGRLVKLTMETLKPAAANDGEAQFVAEQNARVALDGAARQADALAAPGVNADRAYICT
jgi:hypothetical protein